MDGSSEVPVPASFADLTVDWLTEAFRVGLGPTRPDGSAADGRDLPIPAVAGVTVEPLGESVGLLGDLARLSIEYSESGSPEPAIPEPASREHGIPEPASQEHGAGPTSVIVKLPTADPGGRQVGTMLRAWAREVAFYRQIAPASPGAKVPYCYHAAADPAGERWVVVLEDRPMAPIDVAAGATPAQAEAAVDALAAFHCTWWNSERTFDWMPGFDTTGVGGLQGAWHDALPLFRQRYAHVVPGPTGAWVERFATSLGSWSDQAATEPLTVVHADYRLDNLIFAPDGPTDESPLEVTMIDWQTALRGPGAMDLTSFCATSLTIDDRRANEAHLIARYLDGLAAGGVDVDRAWFERSYDENLLWWMGQFANNLARLEPDDAATQEALDTMIERTYTAALDRNVGRLLR